MRVVARYGVVLSLVLSSALRRGAAGRLGPEGDTGTKTHPDHGEVPDPEPSTTGVHEFPGPGIGEREPGDSAGQLAIAPEPEPRGQKDSGQESNLQVGEKGLGRSSVD